MSTARPLLYIAPLAPQHARAAALLHMAGQPGTFLTALGEEVLTVVYSALPRTTVGFGFAALDASCTPHRVAGFISATTSTGGLFAQIGIEEGGRLISALLRAVARDPSLMGRIVRTAAYPFMSAGEGTLKSAELLSIMVEPALRSSGIGRVLMATLVDACLVRGIDVLDVTVDSGNGGARRFYERHGFGFHKEFELYGRAMCQYQRPLTGHSLGSVTGELPVELAA